LKQELRKRKEKNKKKERKERRKKNKKQLRLGGGKDVAAGSSSRDTMCVSLPRINCIQGTSI